MQEHIKNKIINAILEEKKPIKEVASKLFVTERQLKVLLEKWGVALPRKREYNKVPRPDRNTLMMMYKKEGTTQKVADFYGVGINTANKWMRELKIPTRRMKMSDEAKRSFLEEHIAELGDIKL